MNTRSTIRAAKCALYTAHAYIGVLGWTGLALAVCAIAVALIPDREAFNSYHRLQAQLARVRADAHRPSQAAAAIDSSVMPASEEQLALLTDAPGLFADIVQRARDKSIPITQADYRYTPATNSAPGTYEMACHLHAHYLPMRQFVQEVLNALPVVAVRDVRFARETAGQSELDTHVRFVVFVRPEAR